MAGLHRFNLARAFHGFRKAVKMPTKIKHSGATISNGSWCPRTTMASVAAPIPARAPDIQYQSLSIESSISQMGTLSQ